ncbi:MULTISPECIES: helix-turn-helix domain-containing protein [Ralstonia]|jgi:DNA binding domain, excisionase family|uniref:helix-turn-helix domain-containing protein n=1 Tax=Ralstonia pickettii TaxID=329 RepID=UPI000467DB59|nr:hypothetical protein BEK68_09730 [Ralstonia pickettii]
MLIAVLTADQVAEALGCTPEHVNALAASRNLPAVKFGRSWRFPAAALARFLDEQATANLTLPVQHIQAVQPIKATKRGKPLPDLMRAAREAGLPISDQLSLSHGVTRTT